MKNDNRLKIRRYVRAILEMFALIILISIINMFLPLLTSKIVNEGIVENNIKITLRYTLEMIGVVGVSNIISIWCEYIRIENGIRLQTDLKKKVFDKLLKIKINYFDTKSSTQIYQQIEEDVLIISGCFSAEFVMSIMQIVSAMGMFYALWKIGGKLAFSLFLAIPTKLLQVILYYRIGYGISEKRLKTKNELSSCIAELVQANVLIRCFSKNEFFIHRVRDKQHDLAEIQIKYEKTNELKSRMEGYFIEIVTAVSYIVAVFLISSKELTIGDFIAFQTYSASGLVFINQFFNVIYSISFFRPSLERYKSFINYEEEQGGGLRIGDEPINIELRDVSFGYNKRNVIHKMNMSIPYGKHIAIVGENGSGKTTFIKLLLGLVTPQKGNIYINNHKIEEYDLVSYRKIYSVSNQDTILFNDSIKNNITMYDEYAEEEIEEVIKKVGLDDLIYQKGIDYIVGENGCELSGGQRQLICLARVILHNRKIVIFDEAEENIDSRYLDIFSNLLKNELKGKTVIMITHRELLMECADAVINIELLGR